MEIHQLEYVVAVDKYRHFSKAAEEICLSQSTLSQQIKKLEDELGVQLFERNTRHIQPTPAGKEFISYAKRILDEVERARHAMQAYLTLERGKIVIGAVPILGYLGFTSVIASFQKDYPGIQLEIREATSDHLLKWLEQGEIDVALTTYADGAEHEEGIEFQPLLEDEVVLVTNHDHPLAKRKKIDLLEAAHENFVSIKSSHAMRSLCEQACMAAGFTPNIIFESTQVETIRALVEEGLGVALLTHRVARFIPRSRIAIIRLRQSITKTTAIAVSRQHHLTPAVSVFRQYLCNWVHATQRSLGPSTIRVGAR